MTTATPASRRRLTRAESQERTRARIVEAATKLFLRDGFRVVSLEQVAEEAGFTRGAVYSNFENKTAMGIAVIDELYAREQRRLDEALAVVSGEDTEGWFDALSRWAQDTIGDPAWTRLEIEVAAFSAHDPAHRAATAARYERMRARCIEHLRDRFGDRLPVDVETLGTAIVGLALGVGAQRAADPSVAGSAWSEPLRAFARLAV